MCARITIDFYARNWVWSAGISSMGGDEFCRANFETTGRKERERECCFQITFIFVYFPPTHHLSKSGANIPNYDFCQWNSESKIFIIFRGCPRAPKSKVTPSLIVRGSEYFDINWFTECVPRVRLQVKII